jgi:hypothetical protein
MRRNLAVPIVALFVVGWGLARLVPLQAQTGTAPIPKDTIFESNSNTTPTDTNAQNQIWKITPGKAPEVYATVNSGLDATTSPWLCPIGVSPSGHLYVVSKGNNGTLWDVTAGGDRSSDKAVATAIFTDAPTKLCGIAFDAAGNVYLDNSEPGGNPIMKVAPDGKVSALKGTYDGPRGLAVAKDANSKEILYIAQASDGTVQTYNLTDDQPGTEAFATGFKTIADHTPGSIVVDHRDHILLLWRTSDSDGNNNYDNSGAVFDITKGGDFSSTFPVLKTQFRMDVNQMAVDSLNNLYIAGNDSRTCWMSTFDSSKGTYTSLVPISGTAANLGDVGDSEAIAIAP